MTTQWAGLQNFFPTHMCNSTHLLVLIGLFNHEIGVILVGCEDVFYCGSTMCNDKARNLVIYSSNANIHVFVHEDFK
jgi:hypothetical protein